MAFTTTATLQTVPDAMLGYTTGSATPTMTFGGASVGMTYTTQQCNYTVIGDRVFYNLRVTLSAKGSSTGLMLILTGIPFVALDNVASAIHLTAVTAAAAEKHVSCDITGGSASARVWEIGTAATDIAVQYTDAQITNTSDIMISGNYRIAV